MDTRRDTRHRGPRGFTLVELLVVVAIITILISMMMPSLAGAREQARKALCMNHQRQLAIANDFYTRDYAGLLPHYDLWLWNGGDPGKPLDQARIPESGQLFGRKQGAKEGLKSQYGRKIGTNYAISAEIYKCPSDIGKRLNPVIQPAPAKFSYSRNKYLMDVLVHAEMWLGGFHDYLPMDKPRRPSQTPLMLEENADSALNDGFCFPIDDVKGIGSSQDFLSLRHANKAIFSYHDLHAEPVRVKEFNETVWSDAHHRLLAPGLPRPMVPVGSP